MAFQEDFTNSVFSPDEFAHFKIPLENIISATDNFADVSYIGGSILAKRYKGQLLLSGELIDIDARRYNQEYKDIDKLFWMEVSMLSSLRHPNLVSFVGFCDENGEKIVITKHETRESLGLYLSDPMLLTWVRRLEICVGIAKALCYIHYDESRDFSVIHRNIQCGTVLLHEDWTPKLYGFQFSIKINASQRHQSFYDDTLEYVNGYGDPTYIETATVSHKSDIYSFGVVMFELLCGMEAVIDDDQENTYFTSAVLAHYREKNLDEIIDWVLWNQMDSQSFNIFAEIAYDCLNEERSKRPNIDEIVTRLEKALELQLEYESSRLHDLAHYAALNKPRTLVVKKPNAPFLAV